MNQKERDLGFMLYDMNYADPENIKPPFFGQRFMTGVLDPKAAAENYEPS